MISWECFSSAFSDYNFVFITFSLCVPVLFTLRVAFLQVNITFQDLIDTSCLNGWTCGNIAASPSDVARFHWDLQHGNIISNESLRQMMNFKNMDVGWNPQKYGLAMMEQWPGEFCR